jgi:hypothetical protein
MQMVIASHSVCRRLLWPVEVQLPWEGVKQEEKLAHLADQSVLLPVL